MQCTWIDRMEMMGLLEAHELAGDERPTGGLGLLASLTLLKWSLMKDQTISVTEECWELRYQLEETGGRPVQYTLRTAAGQEGPGPCSHTYPSGWCA